MFQSGAAKVTAAIEGVALLLMVIAVCAKVSVVGGLILFIISLPLAILYVYDVDCTFVGNCDVWGWIKTIILSIYYLIIIVAMIALLSTKKLETADTNTSDDVKLN